MKTNEIAVITNNHSVFEMLKKHPAAITENEATKCIQELCCVLKKSLNPCKANLKLLTLELRENPFFSLFFTQQK